MQSGSSVHQSALLLHSMAAHDRDWLLARLDQPERERLQVLLDELKSLGIPADASVVGQGLAAVSNEDDQDSPDPWQMPVFDHVDSDTLVERLFMAGPEQLTMILKAEPDLLVARFLSMHQWPWCDDVLARLGPVKGRGIRKHMQLLSLQAGADGKPLSGDHTATARMLMSLVWAQLEARAESSPAAEAERYQRQGIGRGHWFRLLNSVAARFLKPRRA